MVLDIFLSRILPILQTQNLWNSPYVNIDSRQLASRREWLELSRKQIAEYAGIPVCAVDLLEVGKEVEQVVANAYAKSLDKLEFRRMMANLP
jgi:hypothetical protein